MQAATPAAAPARKRTNTRLTGPLLFLALAAWMLTVLWIASLFSRSIQPYLHYLQKGYLGAALPGTVPDDNGAYKFVPLPNSAGEFPLVILANSPAAQAGLHTDDVLLAVNGQLVQPQMTTGAVIDMLQCNIGDRRTLSVRHTTGVIQDDVLVCAAFPTQGWRVAFLIYSLILFLASVGTAAIVVWHRANDWLALDISVTLLLFMAYTSPIALIVNTTSGNLNALAAVSLVGALFIFPDGRFSPRALLGSFALWAVWTLVDGFLPLTGGLLSGLIFLAYCLGILLQIYRYLKTPGRRRRWRRAAWMVINVALILAVAQLRTLVIGNYSLFLWLLAGIAAQVYRYYRVATPAQRQQTRWIIVTLGLYAFLFLAWLGILLVIVIAPGYGGQLSLGLSRNLLVILAVVYALNLLLVISFSVSLLRNRLWDVDIFINHALVYGALTALLAIIGAAVSAVLVKALGQFFGDQSLTVAVLASAVPVALGFVPLRDFLQRLVDKFFQLEQVDFSQAFVEFTPEVRPLFSVSELARILAGRVAQHLGASFGVVFLRRADGQFHTVAPPDATDVPPLVLDPPSYKQILAGKLAVQPEESLYALFVPLVVLRAGPPDLIGVLALSHRVSGHGYSSLAQSALCSLGVQAGTAIFVAQLFEQNALPLEARVAALESRFAALWPAAPPAAAADSH